MKELACKGLLYLCTRVSVAYVAFSYNPGELGLVVFYFEDGPESFHPCRLIKNSRPMMTTTASIDGCRTVAYGAVSATRMHSCA
jgi:hypothetical protein